MVVAIGCTTGTPCADEGGGADASASDAYAPIGAGGDALVPIDVAPAACTSGYLEFVPLRVIGPAESISASLEPDREYRIRIFRHSDGLVVFDATGTTATLVAYVGRVVPGEYDAALESGDYVAGAQLIRPSSCSEADPLDDVRCRPVRFVVRPCEARTVAVALYCDPAIAACEDAAWPWER